MQVAYLAYGLLNLISSVLISDYIAERLSWNEGEGPTCELFTVLENALCNYQRKLMQLETTVGEGYL
jgi:hypothetical protein